MFGDRPLTATEAIRRVSWLAAGMKNWLSAKSSSALTARRTPLSGVFILKFTTAVVVVTAPDHGPANRVTAGVGTSSLSALKLTLLIPVPWSPPNALGFSQRSQRSVPASQEKPAVNSREKTTGASNHTLAGAVGTKVSVAVGTEVQVPDVSEVASVLQENVVSCELPVSAWNHFSQSNARVKRDKVPPVLLVSAMPQLVWPVLDVSGLTPSARSVEALPKLNQCPFEPVVLPPELAPVASGSSSWLGAPLVAD